MDESNRWLTYARSDLDVGQMLLNDPHHYPRQVCIMAQQAAEKALKAILVLLEIDFPKTHDLDRLRDLIPPGWQVKTEHPDLADLTIWSVEARYPGDLPYVTEVDAWNALHKAEAVYQSVINDQKKYSQG